MEEENKVVAGLKVEVYDLAKEVQMLSGVVGHLGTVVGLEGEGVTIDNIVKAVTEKFKKAE